MDASAALILAEAHLGTFDYSGNRPALLLYFRSLLDASGATSAKADAVQGWLNAMIFTASLQPDQIEAALTPPPFPFSEVAVEVSQAVAGLQS